MALSGQVLPLVDLGNLMLRRVWGRAIFLLMLHDNMIWCLTQRTWSHQNDIQYSNMAFRWIITASRFSGRYALIALMDSYGLISVGFEIMHRRKNEGERRTRKVEWSPNDTLDRFITENLISKHFQSKHFPDSGNLHNLHSVTAQWLAAWAQNQMSAPAFQLQLLPLMNKYYQAPIQTAGNLILFHWDFCHCR